MQLLEEIRSADDEFMRVPLAKAMRVGTSMLFVQHLAIHFLEMRVCPRPRDEVIVHPFRGSRQMNVWVSEGVRECEYA